jgi:hypothetical protein
LHSTKQLTNQATDQPSKQTNKRTNKITVQHCIQPTKQPNKRTNNIEAQHQTRQKTLKQLKKKKYTYANKETYTGATNKHILKKYISTKVCTRERNEYNNKTQDTPQSDNEKVQGHVKQQITKMAAQKPAHTLAIERDNV